MTSAPQEEEKTQPQIEKADQAKRKRDINWAAALATIIGVPLAIVAIALGLFHKEVRDLLNLDATPIPSSTATRTPVASMPPTVLTPAITLSVTAAISSESVTRIDALLNRGTAYASQGDDDRAIKDFDEALLIEPRNVRAYVLRGLAYHRKGDNDRAIKDFDQALVIEPDDIFVYASRGWANIDKGDITSAIDDCNRAILIKPDCDYAFYIRGLAYSTKGDTDQSLSDFQTALALTSDPGIRAMTEAAIKQIR